MVIMGREYIGLRFGRGVPSRRTRADLDEVVFAGADIARYLADVKHLEPSL